MSNHIKKLVSEISKATDGLNSSVARIQQNMLDEIEVLLKDIEVKGRGVAVSTANLKKLVQIKSRLEAIVLRDKGYLSSLQEYVNSYNRIVKLQNEYFASIKKGYKPTTFLRELQKTSMDATIESLTSGGVSAAVTEPIRNILKTNITSGAKYTDMVKQVRNFITTNNTGSGALERYVKQISTDALNQFSAQYMQTVSGDLGLQWYRYTGAEIETSRPWCKAILDKKFVHVSEFPDLLKGNFPEFKDNDGKINPRNGLPYGMIDGTNEATLVQLRGGHQCGHQMVPVPHVLVPIHIRNAAAAKGFWKEPRKTA